jgi:hypothetical protein
LPDLPLSSAAAGEQTIHEPQPLPLLDQREKEMNFNFPKRTPLLVTCVVICFVFVVVAPVLSNDRKELKHHSDKGIGHASKNKDHGNETTGEIAAWMFGVANFPVALSVILKAFANLVPAGLNLRDPVTRFNRQQKKHLIKLHYWLNPIALGIALTHFLLSMCRSTTLPEWGLGIMVLTGLLGIMMKFKLSPASMRQKVFKFHTSPVLLIAAISILLIGHSIVD